MRSQDKENVPQSLSTKENIPQNLAAREDVLQSTCGKENIPGSHGIKENVPKRLVAAEDVPKVVRKTKVTAKRVNHMESTRDRENVPKGSGNKENSPKHLANKENGPKPLPSKENGPKPLPSKENGPKPLPSKENVARKPLLEVLNTPLLTLETLSLSAVKQPRMSLLGRADGPLKKVGPTHPGVLGRKREEPVVLPDKTERKIKESVSAGLQEIVPSSRVVSRSSIPGRKEDERAEYLQKVREGRYPIGNKAQPLPSGSTLSQSHGGSTRSQPTGCSSRPQPGPGAGLYQEPSQPISNPWGDDRSTPTSRQPRAQGFVGTAVVSRRGEAATRARGRESFSAMEYQHSSQDGFHR